MYTTLVRKELTELARNYKLVVGLAVFLFFALLSPITARYLPQIIGLIGSGQGIEIQLPTPTYRDALAQYVKNLSQIVTFALIFLAMGAVCTEKESGTAAFLLVKPVRRSSFVVAKLTSMVALVAAGMLLGGVSCGAYTVLLFGDLPIGRFLGINLLLALYTTTIVSVTLLSSTLSRSQAVAGIAAILAWMFLSLAAQIPTVGSFSPGSLVAEAQGLITADTVAWQPVVGSAVLIVACCGAAIGALRRWEP